MACHSVWIFAFGSLGYSYRFDSLFWAMFGDGGNCFLSLFSHSTDLRSLFAYAFSSFSVSVGPVMAMDLVDF